MTARACGRRWHEDGWDDPHECDGPAGHLTDHVCLCGARLESVAFSMPSNGHVGTKSERGRAVRAMILLTLREDGPAVSDEGLAVRELRSRLPEDAWTNNSQAWSSLLASMEQEGLIRRATTTKRTWRIEALA